MRYFLDCEFDSHAGALISIALVPEEGDLTFYAVLQDTAPLDPWVQENVLPILNEEPGDPAQIRDELADFIALTSDGAPPVFISDHPADTWRLAQFLVLPDEPANTIRMPERYSFEVCYTDAMREARRTVHGSAIPHNALEDARALRRQYLAAHGLK